MNTFASAATSHHTISLGSTICPDSQQITARLSVDRRDQVVRAHRHRIVLPLVRTHKKAGPRSLSDTGEAQKQDQFFGQPSLPGLVQDSLLTSPPRRGALTPWPDALTP